MAEIPLSLGLDGQALRPDYVLKCSYGNDSIALIQWIHEYDLKHQLGKVVVLYNDTGWSSAEWPARVLRGESLARSYGFIPERTKSIGMERLIMDHQTWPDSQMRFCTEDLKIMKTQDWLTQHDPSGLACMVCGVRREESFARSKWPEWVQSSDKNAGRSDWSPLVLVQVAERDELIRRAGWEPLPHRSRECRCILAKASDIVSWSEADIAEIEAMEAKLGRIKHQQGPNQFMFRPHRYAGRPEGIRAVVAWAKGVMEKRAKNGIQEPAELEPGSCDSGFCTG